MPRVADDSVRTMLVERAAEMLSRREPVTLRSLVTGTGVSTMAVYTHFDGMAGLWREVRREGFVRLAARLATVPASDDPVHDLAALGAAYQQAAVDHPDLYRAMFDAAYALDDPAVADSGFDLLVAAVERARGAGRLAPGTDGLSLATRFWASGHGLALLHLTGILPEPAWRAEAQNVAVALLVDAGDDREACRRSVEQGWTTVSSDERGLEQPDRRG